MIRALRHDGDVDKAIELDVERRSRVLNRPTRGQRALSKISHFFVRHGYSWQRPAIVLPPLAILVGMAIAYVALQKRSITSTSQMTGLKEAFKIALLAFLPSSDLSKGVWTISGFWGHSVVALMKALGWIWTLAVGFALARLKRD